MSGEDNEVIRELYGLLQSYMKGHTADLILSELSVVIRDEKDGCELVRLMQKWMACI